jgi:hypothetical protein
MFSSWMDGKEGLLFEMVFVEEGNKLYWQNCDSSCIAD